MKSAIDWAARTSEKRGLDADRCPAILRETCAVHIPFKLAAIKCALSDWPMKFYGLALTERTGSWSYPESLISSWLAEKEYE
jgi:hypothetical protein